MSIKVLGIDHLVLRTRDVPALLRFYCEGLGCTIEKRRDDLGLVHVRAGRSLIDIVDVNGPLGQAGGAPPGPEGRNLDHFALRVETLDVQAIRAHLGAIGATPTDVVENLGAEGTGPAVYVRDPDGNTVELKGPSR